MTTNIESKSENGHTLNLQETKEDPDLQEEEQQQDNRPKLEVSPPINLSPS